MGRKATLKLQHQDRLSLQMVFNRGENWRERQRAHTLILLDNGLSMKEVAELVEINVRTVGSTRRQWLAQGAASLPDQARPGAPRKITSGQREDILNAACCEPLTAKALLTRHLENGGEHVHLNTLIGVLRSGGLVYKRTRHSLKKKEMKSGFRLRRQT